MKLHYTDNSEGELRKVRVLYGDSPSVQQSQYQIATAGLAGGGWWSMALVLWRPIEYYSNPKNVLYTYSMGEHR